MQAILKVGKLLLTGANGTPGTVSQLEMHTCHLEAKCAPIEGSALLVFWIEFSWLPV